MMITFLFVKIYLSKDVEDIEDEILNLIFKNNLLIWKLNSKMEKNIFFKVTKLYLPSSPEKSSIKLMKNKKNIKVNCAKIERRIVENLSF